jgi:hypothetical protein
VFAVVLHVVSAKGKNFAERELLELRSGIPIFACGDVHVAILVDVPDCTAFVVVDVELLDRKADLRRFRLGGSFGLLGKGRRAEEEGEGQETGKEGFEGLGVQHGDGFWGEMKGLNR